MEMVMTNGFAELSVNEMDIINGGGAAKDFFCALGGTLCIALAPVGGVAVGFSPAGPLAGAGAYFGLNYVGAELLDKIGT